MTSRDDRRTGGPMSSGRPGREAPWQLAAAGVIWLIFGIMQLVLGVNLGAAQSETGAEQVTSQLGSDAVAGSAGSSGVDAVEIVVGVLLLVATLLLATGKGWARHVLVLLGMVAVIDLALDGKWPAVLAMVLLVLGTVPMMSIALHRYLSGRDPDSAASS